MSLSLEDFSFISNLVKKNSGIFISQDKIYLIESRLMPIVKKFSLTDIAELIQKIRSSNDLELISLVTEAMMTNESSFFRDTKPFENFKKIIVPKLIESSPSKFKFRVWSAACSSGQEPYSIAMTILENLEWAHKYSFDIVASDLSTKILEKAISASYSQFEVQRGMPISLLLKYFKQSGDEWLVNDKVKTMVQFSKVNLVESFAHLGKFDVIFCRNVLIYFDTETKVKILHQMSKALNPGGMLVLGGSESIMNSDLFDILENSSSIYILK